MNALETKQAIQSALSEFASKPLAEAATALLEVLGYQSQKRTVLKPNTADNFVESFADKRQFNKEQRSRSASSTAACTSEHRTRTCSKRSH